MENVESDQDRNHIAKYVSAVMRSRHSVRAFLTKPVERAVVEAILADASTAPSGANVQPWRVYVVTGKVKDHLCDALLDASRSGAMPAPTHFPDPLPEVYRARLQDFGARYYESLGIDRADTAGRTRQSERNLTFFGAPVGLIFAIDHRLRPHSWLDLGMFAQNVMIAAKARGLDTCPQVSFAPFHAVIAEFLQLRQEEVTAFGMSLGHADLQAPVNQLAMPRERVRDFAQIVGFPEPDPMP